MRKSFLFLIIALILIFSMNTFGCTTSNSPQTSPPPPLTLVPTIPPEPSATAPSPVTWLVDWPVAKLTTDFLKPLPFRKFWQDGNTLLITQAWQTYQLNIISTHVSAPILIPTPTPLFANPYSFSPNKNYLIECEPTQLTLYLLPSHQILGEFQTILRDCETIRWRMDETAFSFTDETGQVFVWEFLAQPPQALGTGAVDLPAPWSPDGNKILVFVPNGDDVTYTLFSIKMNEEKHNTDISVGRPYHWSPNYVRWVTNDLIENSIAGPRHTVLGFFDAGTGAQLTLLAFQYDDNGFMYSQYMETSPDHMWIIFDHRTVDENPLHQYRLFDLDHKQIFPLLESVHNFLHFLKWTSDSTRFYLLSRPIDATTAPDPTLPSGLLALDPNTRQFTQVIPGAMYATLNSQQTHVFALLPENDHLTAALYTLSGELLATFQPVTDALPYLTPGEGLPSPAAWSNDGTQIVFSDMWGDLWLADTTGALIQLADNLGFDAVYPRQPKFSWSPDDSHLLITFNERAWVITLP